MNKSIVKKVTILVFLLVMGLVNMGYAKKDEKLINYIKDSDQLPFSDQIKVGKLKNGLTYYIKHNDFPVNKIEMRLNIRSGSLDENDSEQGVAHFVEHMAFNGTKNFKGNDVIKFLEKVGLSFGTHSNASTSTDYTNYQLSIPADDPKLIKDSFKIFRDWADAISFDESEIEKEKGVVVEEFNSRNDFRYRLGVKNREIIFENSLYAVRDPIGKMDVILNADKALLKGYYDKWYRASNMSIIVVGDINIEQIEKMIEDTFSSLSADKLPQKADKNIPVQKGLSVHIISDPEAKSSSVSLTYLKNEGRVKTFADLKKRLLEQASLSMLNRRVSLKILEDKSDLIGFSAATSNYSDNLYGTRFNIVTTPKNIKTDIEILLIEIENIKRNGFNQQELDEFISKQQSALTRFTQPDYKDSSERIASMISSYDIKKDYLTEYHQDKILFDKILNESKLSDYNKAFNKLVDNENQVVLVAVPERDLEMVDIDSKTFKSIKQKVSKMKIEKYKGSEAITTLINKKIASGKIKSQKRYENINSDLIIFENGAQLLIKKTDADKNKFMIIGNKLGGKSVLNDKEIILSSLMLNTIRSSGFKDITLSQLRGYLADKSVSLAPSIKLNTFSFDGAGDSKDIETAFQLLYNYMTVPVIDDNVFDHIIDQTKISLGSDKKDKYQQFIREAVAKMYNDNYRREYLLDTDLVDLKKSDLLEIYNKNFRDIGNYKFVVVGDVNKEEVVKYAEKYIASLPSSSKKSSTKFLNVDLVAKRGKSVGYGDVLDKATVMMIFDKDIDYIKNGEYISALVRRIISKKLREKIREDMSGVYSSNVMIRYTDFPEDSLFARISFTTSSSKRDDIIKETTLVFNNIIKHGVTKQDLEIAKSQQILQLDQASQNNKFWATSIASNLIEEDTVLSADEMIDIIEKITIDDINKFITKSMSDMRSYITIYDKGK